MACAKLFDKEMNYSEMEVSLHLKLEWKSVVKWVPGLTYLTRTGYGTLLGWQIESTMFTKVHVISYYMADDPQLNEIYLIIIP